VIRRIDEFHDIDLFAIGDLALFTYDDRPGVSGQLGELFSQNNINILDGRYKTSRDGTQAVAALKTAVPVPASVIKKAAQLIQAHRAFSVHFIG
jgi:D-3-phosphoglycerate dehydrogenase